MSDNISAFDSDNYDEQIRKTIPFYDEFYKQIADIVKIIYDKPLRWLDVGCGTGKTAEAAFGNVDIDRFVFCDNSPQMIEIVKKRFQVSNTEFLNAPVQELDFHKQFDVITAIQVLHYFGEDERAEVIRKCYSALCDKGIFITFENFAPNSSAGKEILLKRWELYQLSQGKTAKECSEHIARYGKNYFPVTVVKSLDILRECGFGQCEIIWLSNMQTGLMGIK